MGITIAVRNSKAMQPTLKYYRVPEYWRKVEKLAFLNKSKSIEGIDWLDLQPDERNTWITEGLDSVFSSFVPLGTKEAKVTRSIDSHVIFKSYSGGVKTNRDNWVYDFNRNSLEEKVKKLIGTYNDHIDRWRRHESIAASIDDFVTYDDTKIKWSGDLKLNLQRAHYAKFAEEKIYLALNSPFCKQYLFFDRVLNERVYKFPSFFPSLEKENVVIAVSGIGADHLTFLAANSIVDVKCGINGNSTIQCFPFYTYSEDGNNRHENITDWALKQFQEKYGLEVTKWDIFHYVYGMLHHPQYRELYKENLKRDLPHIPLLLNQEGFEACVSVGKQLMDMHVHYEDAQVVEEYPLKHVSDKNVPHLQRLRVEKMKLSADKTSLVVSKGLTLEGIPLACFEYRLGNRSALEWVIDQYQVSTDKRSGIESDPNRLDDPDYIVRLVKQVMTLSVKTVELVKELAEAVTAEDWLGGQSGKSVVE